MTRKELASKLGISESMLSHLLTGSKRPSLSRAIKLERQTGIEAKVWLFDSPGFIVEELHKKYPDLKRKKVAK